MKLQKGKRVVYTLSDRMKSDQRFGSVRVVMPSRYDIAAAI
jgi:hypothetical protein